jgi:hypothetical protein
MRSHETIVLATYDPTERGESFQAQNARETSAPMYVAVAPSKKAARMRMRARFT